MAYNPVTLQVLGAQTTSGVGPVFDTGGFDEFHAGMFQLNVTAVGGTLPTLDVYVQIPTQGSTAFIDIVAFSQVMSAGRRVAVVAFPTPGGFAEGAVAPASLPLGQVRHLPMGPRFRVQWVIGGTASPSFTFEVLADLFG